MIEQISLRRYIYSLIKKAEVGERASRIYDYFISAVAIISIIPLMFKETNALFDAIDLVTVYILFADYIMRWMTADYFADDNSHSPWAFVKYPIRPLAILDLVSLLPSLGLLHHGWRILRMMRIFKILPYSKTFSYILNVFSKQRKTLLSVLCIAVTYIFISALAMFSYEPDTFDSFFGALYWATTALTTVGYGDVYPITDFGKLISMVSSLFGIAVIALPAGIVTAGFVDEIQADVDREAHLEAELKEAKAEKEAEIKAAEEAQNEN